MIMVVRSVLEFVFVLEVVHVATGRTVFGGVVWRVWA